MKQSAMREQLKLKMREQLKLKLPC
jgi:hypothetical protein